MKEREEKSLGVNCSQALLTFSQGPWGDEALIGSQDFRSLERMLLLLFMKTPDSLLGWNFPSCVWQTEEFFAFLSSEPNSPTPQLKAKDSEALMGVMEMWGWIFSTSLLFSIRGLYVPGLHSSIFWKVSCTREWWDEGGDGLYLGLSSAGFVGFMVFSCSTLLYYLSSSLA